MRKVWLSLYDGDNISKDEQQVKEFMIAKYERKRYYVKPSDLEKGKDLTNNSGFYSQNMSRLPPSSVSYTAQSVNNNMNRNYNNNMFSSQETTNKPKEVVKVPDQDPFSAANVNISLNQPIDNFANFDNNPIFDSVSSNFVTVSQDRVINKSQPPSEDKYAALKDLDFLMKSQTQTSSEPSNTSVVDWESNNIWPQASSFPQSSAFVAPSTTSYKDFNPFTVGNPEVIWNSDSVGNPFNTDFPWTSANGQIVSTSSSANHFNTTKPRNSGVTPNPFTVSSTGQSVSHPSNNPFL
nr:beclin-1-like protein A isoform X2 [Halyomorpha halys]